MGLGTRPRARRRASRARASANASESASPPAPAATAASADPPAPRRARATTGDDARAGRGRRRIRLDNDARRAQLVALAIRQFAERTYDEVSIDEFARAAGVSKGLLYHYFPTKRDLYLAGLRATADELIARTAAAAAPALPPLDRIRAGIDAYLEHIARHGRAFVALMRGGIGSDPEVASVIEGVRRTYVEQLLAQAGGTPLAGLSLTEPRVRLAVRGWIGLVEATSIDWLANPGVDRAAVRELVIDSLIAIMQVALRAPRPA